MPWFRVDDDFHNHPKVVALRHSPLYGDCVGLWALAGSWCAHYLTDGFLPKSLVKTLGFRQKVADELVCAGLWERVEKGYRFHQWAERQPARSAVEQRRETTKQRVAAWRAKKQAEAQGGNAVTEESHAACNAEVTPAVRNAPVPVPYPDPIKISESEGGSWDCPPRAHARESALGPDWTAERQAVAFRKAYLVRRQVDPSMGGKQVGDFHRRVLETAQARQVDPAVLFDQVLQQWLARDLNQREKSAPYACFANAFGELVDAGDHGTTSAELRLMQQQVAEAWRVVRGGR